VSVNEDIRSQLVEYFADNSWLRPQSFIACIGAHKVN